MVPGTYASAPKDMMAIHIFSMAAKVNYLVKFPLCRFPFIMLSKLLEL
jgi:hypothetical protein